MTARSQPMMASRIYWVYSWDEDGLSAASAATRPKYIVHTGLSDSCMGQQGSGSRRSHRSFQWTDHEALREKVTDRRRSVRTDEREIDLAGRWTVRRTAVIVTAADAPDDNEDALTVFLL